MNTKLVAIVVAVVVVAGGVAAHKVFGDSNEEEKGGWYAWDPETFLVSSSNLAPSPYWGEIIENMYEKLYGELPSYDKYTIDDIPEDFLAFDSLVSYDGSGNPVIEVKYKPSTSEWGSYNVTIDETPTGLITSGSYMNSLYYILCIDAGVDPMAYDEDIVAKMWSMAYGGDQSLFKGMEPNYGIPVAGFSGTELPNPYFLEENKEVTLKCIEQLAAEGKTTLWIAGGSMPAYDKGGEWIKDIMEEYGGYSVTFSISTFPECLATIEAIAHIFGYGDSAQKIIDTLRIQMYTLQESAKEIVERTGRQYTGLGTYTNSDWAFPDASGAGEMFRILSIKNVYTLPAGGNWDGENVIKAEPDVILFSLSDVTQVDWDQAMRVPQSAAA